MIEPVLIENGDLICVDVVKSTLWIEKKAESQKSSSPVPETPTPEKSMGKRRCPIGKILTGKQIDDTRAAAMNLAYAIAWVAGFRVGDNTDLYVHSQDIFVFEVLTIN